MSFDAAAQVTEGEPEWKHYERVFMANSPGETQFFHLPWVVILMAKAIVAPDFEKCALMFKDLAVYAEPVTITINPTTLLL